MHETKAALRLFFVLIRHFSMFIFFPCGRLRSQSVSIGNESVPKIIINNSKFLF